MKKIFFLLPLLLVFFTCGQAQTKTDDTKKNVIMIESEEDFLNKVYNYKKNPEKWVYEGTTPCIVDFYADWCGPCRMIAPIMEELAGEYKGKIIIYKVNTDKVREPSQVFQIRSIPTLFFCTTEKLQAISGAFPKDQYVQMIESNLLQKTSATTGK